MIPIRLTMNAFGPFAKQQEIDFALSNRRIFLITGETGAGKTTIFDAISFALYGNASGESRKSYTLKSHHAPVTELCWVRFRFALHDEEYEVYRQPLQPGQKRDGSPKEIGERAELYLPDDTAVAGVTAVTRRLEQILGLNYRQFKQTIMLAQGEFRQLLEASSSQKQEIFSKIFGTEEYRALTDKLSSLQGELGHQVQSGQQAVAHCISELGRLGFPALQSGDAQFLTYEAVAAIAEEGLSLHRAQLEQIDADIAALEKEKGAINLDQARETNQKIDRYHALQASIAVLDAKRPEMEELAQKLELLRAARELHEQEDIIQATIKTRETAQNRLSALEQQAKACKLGLENAEADYALLPDLKKRAETISNDIASLREREKGALLTEQHRQSLVTRKAQLSEREKRLEHLRMIGIQLDCTARIARQQQQLDLLHAYQRENHTLCRLQRQYEQDSAAYTRLYRTFIDGRAAYLAASLAEGKPCPVCGSSEHPAPAAAGSEIVDEESLNSAKNRLDNTLSQIVSCEKEIIKNHDLFTALSNGDISLSVHTADGIIANCAASLATLREQVGTLPPQESSLDSATVAQQIAEEEATIFGDREAIAALEQTLPTMDVPVPVIREQISQLEQAYAELSKSISTTENTFFSTRSANDKLNAELAATRKHSVEIDAQFQSLREQFRQRLRGSGFASYNDYHAVTSTLPDLQRMTAELETYNQTRSTARAQLEALIPDLEGKGKVDLEQITAMIEDLTRRLTALRENRTDIFALISGATGRLEELKRLSGENGSLGRRYAIANDLATLAKGSKGPGVSFERYILAAYFEDIIQIANIHLQRMTGARYRLKRREDKTRGGSSGLDLEVIDSYTGTERSVSTLSGGEGFKASLALALGLSDVVQIYAGGVSIDTMFIDEGFGSLDENSLDSAVQTLLSLESSGRMVGIISHVAQLREAISTKLLVRYSPTGSTAAFSDH